MRLLHTGDFHTAYQQYGIKRRALDFRRGVSAMVNAAIARKVDVVVIAGDLFDMARPPAEEVYFLQDKLRELMNNAIQVAGISGSHDGGGDDWLSVCGVERLDSGVERFTSYNGESIVIGGLNARRKAELPDAIKALSPCDVFVGHQMILPSHDTPIQCDLTYDELHSLLSEKGVRYAALGHIHAYNVVPYDDMIIAYSGALERCDYNENGAKGFIILDFPETGLPAMERVEIATREFKSVSITSEEELEAFKPDNETMWLVSVDRSLLMGRDRAVEKLAAVDAMFKIETGSRAIGADRMLPAFADRPVWERDRAGLALKDVLAKSDGGLMVDEFARSLIDRILETPDQAETIIADFLESAIEDSAAAVFDKQYNQ